MNISKLPILLVDDNASDVELTLHALKANKLMNPVHVAGDGEEALDYIFCAGLHAGRSSDGDPKLILLDLHLPKVSGHEVLQRIKADVSTRSIPVVMLTTSREECDIVESYNLGVNSYIVKPVDFDQFMEVVKRIGLYWLLINEPLMP